MENSVDLAEDIISGLVRDYSDDLLSWAFYKTSKREIAEDLVQETFIAAFKSLENFEGKSGHKTWLFSIMNNKIAEYHRNRMRKGHDQSVDASYSMFDEKGAWIEDSKPEKWDYDVHLLDNPEFKQILALCMDGLPEQWSAALSYKYLTEKKGAAICQELGITESNYWQILHRAKLKVRECLEYKWFK